MTSWLGSGARPERLAPYTSAVHLYLCKVQYKIAGIPRRGYDCPGGEVLDRHVAPCQCRAAAAAVVVHCAGRAVPVQAPAKGVGRERRGRRAAGDGGVPNPELCKGEAVPAAAVKAGTHGRGGG